GRARVRRPAAVPAPECRDLVREPALARVGLGRTPVGGEERRQQSIERRQVGIERGGRERLERPVTTALKFPQRVQAAWRLLGAGLDIARERVALRAARASGGPWPVV